MLVSIFDSGTSSGQAPVNYLLGDKDHTGQIRSVKPELIDGDPQSTIDLINSITRKYKYTSGVIAFRPEENPTDKEQKEIINVFRKSFMPGLNEENFNDLWVAHRDKGRLELHFIVVGEELKSGKQLNISPPGKKNQAHFTKFAVVANQAYGWNQVIPDPLKVALSAFDLKVHNKEAKTSKVIKNYLSEKLHKEILNGKIENRDQLISFLKNHKIEITRVGKDYLSIKMPNDQRARRLKGSMFEEGANYADLVKQHHASKIPTKLTSAEYKQAKSDLNEFISNRKDFNTKLYLTKKTSFRRPRKANTVKSNKDIVKDIQKQPVSLTKQVKLPESVSNNEFKANSKNINASSENLNKSTSSSGSGSGGSTSNAGEGIMLQIGHLETELHQVNVQIGTEKDFRKLAELRAKSIQLQNRIRIMYQNLEDAKKKEAAQLNKKYGLK